jgi:sec-independent protein translocase protein TatA
MSGPSGLGPIGFLGPVGIPELIIILVIILLLFGASRLPEIGRGLGKGIKNFKETTKDEDHRD